MDFYVGNATVGLSNDVGIIPSANREVATTMTHKQISYLKSAIRIVGYLLLIPIADVLKAPPGNLTAAVGVLVVSELIGIWEEWNEK